MMRRNLYKFILWPIIGLCGFFLILSGVYYYANSTSPEIADIPDAESAYQLGMKYKSEIFPFTDMQQAYVYFDHAYKLGHQKSANEWIFLKEYGLGGNATCEDNIERAQNILSQQDSVNAHFVLGRNYAKKDCSFFNLELAEYHLLIAGEKGHLIAQVSLAHFYSELKKDPEKKEYWWEKFWTKEPISEVEIWYGRMKNSVRWALGLKEQY